MDYLQIDTILLEIYTEQKTVAKFIDTVFGFLFRYTNFGLIDGSKRNRLRQLFLDELSIYEPELQGTLEAENVATESAPPAATEIEIETETTNADTGLELKYSIPILDKSSDVPVHSSDELLPDATKFDVQGDFLKNSVEIHNHGQSFKQLRKILPKKHQLIKHIPTVDNFQSKGSTRRIYKCSECSEIFVSFRQLKVHEALHASQADGGISVCVYCCSLYANTETLEKHVTDCHGDGRYLCVPCAKTYKSRGQLLKHVHSIVHNANALLYYCSLCPRSGKSYIEFTSRTLLQQHYQEMHLLMPASQDEDDVEIEMNEEFLDEFLLNNVNENSFNFSECWDALDLNLPDMLRLANTDEVPSHANECNTSPVSGPLFKCPMCFEGSPSQKLLLQHFALKHGLPVLICNKCDSSFTDYTQYMHHKRTHRIQFDAERNTRGSLLQCEICDKILSSNGALNYHVKTHLRSFLQAPHECPFCRKCFHSDINFKKHIRIVHSHIKRHTCELCDKPFATLDHLKKHVLSQHQNERKHICHVCAKSFTQLCHLKQHLAIHTTGKSHKCLKCEGKYWRKIDLQRHMLKKHA